MRHDEPPLHPARGHESRAEEALCRLDHAGRCLTEYSEASSAVEAAACGETGTQTDLGGRRVGHELVAEVVDGAGDGGYALGDLHGLMVATFIQ